jgi:hypothetical protein
VAGINLLGLKPYHSNKRKNNLNNIMNKKILICLAAVFLSSLQPVTTASAQSAFFQAVTNLNPVAYWPLQETIQPPAANVETNLGSFGPSANACYSSANAVTGTTGIPGNGSDPAMSFGGAAGDFMAVPLTYSGVTLPPGPFTVEVWINPANLNAATIIAQTGPVGTGGLDMTANSAGWSLNQKYVPSNNSSVTNGWSFHVYNGAGSAGGAEAVAASPGYASGSWYHLVGVFDGVNATLYVNGVNASTGTPMTGTQAQDTWDPLTVGGGRGLDDNLFNGVIDEVAIYTNALTSTQIMDDYNLGSASGSGYTAYVLANNKPYMYWAMDAPTYIAPASSTFPVATNYGSLTDPNLDGLYQPGTTPGLPGPTDVGLGSPSYACGINGLNAAVVASGTNVTNPAGVLSTNDVPRTMIAWFKSNPADSRNNGYNDIFGHSDNSFRMVLYPQGPVDGNCGSGDINTSDTYNDGKWHFVVAISTNAAATYGTFTLVTNSVYIDGVFEGSSHPTSTKTSAASINVLIGGQGNYLNTGSGYNQRYLAGSVCQVAYFTNAFTLGQIQGLLYAAGVPPAFLQQPAGSVTNFTGATNTFTARASGAMNLIYQWYYTNSSGVVALTNGPGVSGSSVVSGATNSSATVGNVQAADGGYYFVVVTNNFGSITSTLESLTVNAKPAIASQFPITYTNLFTLYAGVNPTFSVLANGAAPLHYQWYTNGVAVAGATNASFTRTNIQIGFITNYCIVTNSGGSATSTVWAASVIADPTNATGGLALYPQAVLALNPVAYWRLNEGNDNGNGDDGYVCNDYADGNDGLYTNALLGNTGYNSSTDPSDVSAEIGSGSYTANSDIGQIGTNIDFGVPSGSNAEFSVEAWVNVAANNGGSIICKGWGGGGEQMCIDTGTSGTHTFRFFVRNAAGTAVDANSSIVPQNNTWYHVVGVCDEANTNITLYVNGLFAGLASIAPSNGIVSDSPVNMTFGARSSSQANGTANPPNLTIQNGEYINDVAVFRYALTAGQVANEYAQSGVAPFFLQQPVGTNLALGNTLRVPVGVYGAQPLSYQWFETNVVASTGYAITGQTNSTLVISNDQAGDSYYLMVTNIYGSTNSSVVSVGVYSSPLITSQLPITYTNQFTLYAGANPRFSVAAIGFQPLSYQWYSNGVPISGATGTNVTLTNVQTGLLNTYCIVTNLVGSATNLWSASVIADPTNSVGGPAPYPQTVLALNPIGYWRLNDTNEDGPDNGDGNSGYICHDYVGGNDGVYTNVYLGNVAGGTGYNPIADPSDNSAEFGDDANGGSDSGDQHANYIEGINFGSPAGTSAAFTVEAWVSGYPQSYSGGIVTLGYGGGGEQFDLDCGAANSAFRFFMRDASGATHLVSSSVLPTTTENQGPWYHLVAVVDEINSQTVTLYVNGVPVGTASVTNGAGVLASSYPMSIGARMGSQNSNFNLQFLGFINDVAVFNYALSPSQVANEYYQSGTPPVITQQPVPGTNVDEGGTLVVPTVVNGTSPLTYRWFDVGANNYLASETNATLVISNLQNSDSYYLTASNPYGSTNTTTVAVTVISGLNASLGPPNVTLYAGRSFTFNVQATGTLPFYYHWYQGASSITGATNATYTAVASGSATYSCTVSNDYNGYSSTNTGPVTLVSIPGPTNFYPLTILSNNPIAYWRLDEVPDNGLGNDGTIAYDYVGGHNAAYTNAELGLPGLGTLDSTDAAAGFGIFDSSPSNSFAGEIFNDGTTPIDFSQPAGSNAEFSVEAWVNSTNTQVGGAGIVAKGYGNGGEQFDLDVDGDFRFFVRDASGAVHGPTSTVAPAIGQWYHLVGVFDGANGAVHLYINGVDIADTTNVPAGVGLLTATTTNALMPQAAYVSIGARTSDQSSLYYNFQFQGAINDVALYNYALSAAQVAAHYAASGLAPAINLNPTNILYSISNHELTLSWPVDHLGWILQAQTNRLSVGINTNWVGVSGSAGTNQVILPINPTNGCVFYRLIYSP